MDWTDKKDVFNEDTDLNKLVTMDSVEDMEKKIFKGYVLDGIYLLIDTKSKFQPLRFFGYNLQPKNWQPLGEPKKINGYKLWINIFEDGVGTNFYIYYPIVSKFHAT